MMNLQTSSQRLITNIGPAALGIIFGVTTALVATALTAKPAATLLLPALIAIYFSMRLKHEAVFIAILLTRAAADSALEEMRIGQLLSAGAFINLFLIAYAAYRTITTNANSGVRKIAMYWLPIAILVAVDAIRSPDFGGGIRLSVLISCSASMCLLGCIVSFESEEGDIRAYRLVLGAMVVPFLIALGMLAAGIGDNSRDPSEGFRLRGPFGHPNILAFFCMLAVSTIIFHGRKIGGVSRWSRILVVSVLLVSLVLLIFTKTRSAWVATLVCLLIHSAFFNRRNLLLIPIAISATLLIPEVRERVFEIGEKTYFSYARTNNSYEWRKLLWTETFSKMSISNFLIGSGSGAFYFDSKNFFSLSNGKSIGAHNVFVQIIYETGLLGLTLYIGAIGLMIRRLCTAKAALIQDKIFGLTLLVCYAIVGYSDNLLDYVAFNCYFFFVMGATLSKTLIVSPSK